MLIGFHHSGVVVRDLDNMVRFYTEDLGLQVKLELDSNAPPEGNHTGIPGSRRRLVFLGLDVAGLDEHASADRHQIELVHYIDPPAADIPIDKHQIGAMHVCLEVDDLQTEYERLLAKGVHFATEPKYSQPSGQGRVGVIYGQDPEGNWFELIEWPQAS
jgi:catechol 2,3-dioxygenase-like lactoylglutathione lyase family enzyme